ncbi:MAG: hypothetical protein QOI90_3026 [Mycobacterium sp.]|jgi:hypothetical protein|nr:hypothetical protein [Mycobacterium sp.]
MVQSRSVANCTAPSAGLVGLGLSALSKLSTMNVEILGFVAVASDLILAAARVRREPANPCSYLWSGLRARRLVATQTPSTTNLRFGNLTVVIPEIRDHALQQGIRSSGSEVGRGALVP